jgi:hypothetical protein
MDQTFKDGIDVVSKLVAAVGILIAALNYRSQTKTKRAEWLKALFEKFYENENFKEVRKWIESGEIEKRIQPDDFVVTKDEEKLTDYLNFFEFIATLEAEGHLKSSDVNNLFDYYLKKLKYSAACLSWIKRPEYGFEKLRTLLQKIER